LLIVLLDADVIIDLHRFGIWESILKKSKILIPSIILRREVFYFIDGTSIKHFKKYLDEGSILRIQRFGLKS